MRIYYAQLDIILLGIILLLVIFSYIWYFRPSIEILIEGSKYHIFLLYNKHNNKTYSRKKIKLK